MKLIEFLRLPLEAKVRGVRLFRTEEEDEYIEYWNGSQIYVHSHRKNGLLHGEYKRWYSDGKQWEHCFFYNGNRHGEYKRWHENGGLEKHSLYENGILIKDYLK